MATARKLMKAMFSNRGGSVQGLNGAFRESFMDAAFKSYVETALWSSVDDAGEALDKNYSEDEIDPGALALMRKDVESFIRKNVRDIGDLSASKVGHDFWLNRNGHGAGFWDLGLGVRGERLAKASKVYGESDLYLGDDSILYIR